MSNLTKAGIRAFLANKEGYIKKSPINVAKAMWKKSPKHSLPRNKADLEKDLKQIKEVQSFMRQAKRIEDFQNEDNIMEIYDKIIQEKNKPRKRLYFDIEVSANVVYAWHIGNKVDIRPDAIIKERAVICVCYKWEGQDKVYSLQWNKGDDSEMLAKFAKIIDSADEVVTQNGDNFDIKWLRTRCIYHGISISPKFNSIDTLKMARGGFKFNSNKLDYMGQYLGLGKKIKTDYDLWKDITLNNSKEAMNKMVEYCKQDVNLLEKVYKKLQNFSPVKKFKYKN